LRRRTGCAPLKLKLSGQLPTEIIEQKVKRRLGPIGRIGSITAGKHVAEKLLAEFAIEQSMV
jgi:hypothetical protein